MSQRNHVTIVNGSNPAKLVEFAASELGDYLRQLFGVQSDVEAQAPRDRLEPCILLGQITDAHVQSACSSLPALSEQGHLLRRLDEHHLLLAGGSGAAVCWAVYELAEAYGVAHLLHGDILPEQPGEFHLPRVDRVLEPVLRLRSWRQFNDLPTGPGLWSLEQQRAFIRQIFKLKYNGIYVCMWPHHPFVDFEVRGIRRQTATMLFGQKIPIEADNIGREHLPDIPYLDNPELAAARTYEEKLAAGQRLMTGILDEAQALGMHTAVHFQPLEFPAEFRPLLQQPTDAAIQLGGLTCAERGDLTNAAHTELIEAMFDAHLQQWGRVDEFHLSLPEHPQADGRFEECWRELDARYQLEPVLSLQEVLERGAGNYLIPGGLERAEREVESAISMLHFCDQLFERTGLLQRAAERDVQVHLNMGGNSEPLFPVLDRILWTGAGISTSLGYTASRAVRALHSMDALNTSMLPATLVITLQDDNVGSLPQVATRSIHQLLDAVQEHGWRGFFTRHWPVGDLDPVAAFMAQRAWDADCTPEQAYAAHFSRVYGRPAARRMSQMMNLLEDATVVLDLDFLGLFFPVLGIVCRSLESDAPMPVGLFHIRATYEQAARVLAQAESRVTTAAGRGGLAYWQSRLEFAIQALIEKEHVHEGARRAQAARRLQISSLGRAARPNEASRQGTGAQEPSPRSDVAEQTEPDRPARSSKQAQPPRQADPDRPTRSPKDEPLPRQEDRVRQRGACRQSQPARQADGNLPRDGTRHAQAAGATDERAERERLLQEARDHLDRAVAAGEAALRATAAQLRDESDVNTLAAYYHFFVREVRQRSDELLAGAEVYRRMRSRCERRQWTPGSCQPS